MTSWTTCRRNAWIFILTDPPYLVRYRDRIGRTIANDNDDAWLAPAFRAMHRILRDDALCVSFYGWPRADAFLAAARAAGFRAAGHIVFPKPYASSARFLRYEHNRQCRGRFVSRSSARSERRPRGTGGRTTRIAPAVERAVTTASISCRLAARSRPLSLTLIRCRLLEGCERSRTTRPRRTERGYDENGGGNDDGQDHPDDKGNPPGKLADAELHFTSGPLAGLKLIGFAIWERRGGTGRNVTFPARHYSVNGERRSFALLRPIADVAAQESVRDAILAAYAETEDATAAAAA